MNDRQVLLDVVQRPHTRAANGAEDWFKAAEDNRMMAKELGFPYIAYHIIMSSAKEAFRESGFDKESVLCAVGSSGVGPLYYI